MVKIIFITGGSASGKTTIANSLQDSFKEKSILISQDMFYKSTSNPSTNYDVPSAFNWEKQISFFTKLKNNENAMIPIYDFVKHKVIGEKEIIPREVIIFEGLFTFWSKELVSLADFQIFIDTPSDTRLSRRLLRDINERGRDPVDIINRWTKDVQPSYIKYISTMKSSSDIIIPWEKINDKPIKALITIIKDL